jgi:hypothetical protein
LDFLKSKTRTVEKQLNHVVDGYGLLAYRSTVASAGLGKRGALTRL